MNKIKNKIQEILDCLPLGIEYRYMQSHLLSALNEANKLDKIKKLHDKKPKQKIENKKIILNKDSIQIIENMIKQEQNFLQEN